MDMKLDHVAIAVSDIRTAAKDFEEKLGVRCDRIEEVPSEDASVAFFDVGGAHIELIQPMSEASALARSLAQRGEGLHHICLEVPDIDAAMALMKSAGLRMVNDKPSVGAGQTRIAFVHPKSMHGVLIELVEKPRA
jgi:methylmalonyl-CoA/ethylmalonyl-CoA epimerase